MNARNVTISTWESTLGREGLWCGTCRRATPVERLLLEQSGHATLKCETCDVTLRSGLGRPKPPRPLDHQLVPASHAGSARHPSSRCAG